MYIAEIFPQYPTTSSLYWDICAQLFILKYMFQMMHDMIVSCQSPCHWYYPHNEQCSCVCAIYVCSIHKPHCWWKPAAVAGKFCAIPAARGRSLPVCVCLLQCSPHQQRAETWAARFCDGYLGMVVGSPLVCNAPVWRTVPLSVSAAVYIGVYSPYDAYVLRAFPGLFPRSPTPGFPSQYAANSLQLSARCATNKCWTPIKVVLAGWRTDKGSGIWASDSCPPH